MKPPSDSHAPDERLDEQPADAEDSVRNSDNGASDWVDTDGLREAHLALDAALDRKALEPVLLDVRSLCSYTNYMLILSGRSDRQVEAISDSLIDALRQVGVRPMGVEGRRSGTWALIDFGDLIAHVFYHPLRDHFDLEGLWIEAARVDIEVPAEARLSVEDVY